MRQLSKRNSCHYRLQHVLQNAIIVITIYQFTTGFTKCDSFLEQLSQH